MNPTKRVDARATEIVHDSFESFPDPNTGNPIRGIRTVNFTIGADYSGIPLAEGTTDVTIYSRVGYDYTGTGQRHEAALYKKGREIGAIHFTRGITMSDVYDAFGINPMPLLPEIISEKRTAAQLQIERDGTINSLVMSAVQAQPVRRLHLVR